MGHWEAMFIKKFPGPSSPWDYASRFLSQYHSEIVPAIFLSECQPLVGAQTTDYVFCNRAL